MKLRVTLEIEVSDLPEEERNDLADGLNFRSDDDETVAPDLDPVPCLLDMGANEITGLPYEFFQGLEEYEVQREIWAGSSVFVYFSELKVTDVMVLRDE